MVIECTSCQARFKLADDKIKENGTKVRCTKCREVFTVFPEKTPKIIVPVIATAQVVDTTKDIIEDDFFSLEGKSPVAPQKTFASVDAPVSFTDDWNQEGELSHSADEAGSTDLDAINFDDFEAPVFSVHTDQSSKFEFNDDSAFSFEDSSPLITVEQPNKIATQSEDQQISAGSENDFEADFSSGLPSTSAMEEPSQTSSLATAGEFTFPEAESSSDFSWGETPIAPCRPAELDDSQKQQTTQQKNTDFDFGSFSFDNEEPEPFVSDENQHDESVDIVTKNETSIELTMDVETSATPALIQPEALKSATTSSVGAIERESRLPSARPLRPRTLSRQTKKVSSDLIFRIFLAILLILGLVFGIMNRERIQIEYKKLVTGFIENQVPAETSGQIGLRKLTGGYLLNSQEGNLFIIRGEAVNEFKGLRSSVLVKGTIYGENGAEIQSQSAYCGNSIKDEILKKLGFKEIREVMNNELGENLVNLNISAGKAVPFTIVFNNVPQNIKEFTVEVVDSKSGSK